MKNIIIMLIVFIISIMAIPVVMIVMGSLNEEVLHSFGVNNNPNYNGGKLLIEFKDPANDLVNRIPQDLPYSNNQKAVDLRSFTVTKVAFSPLSGHGISARINLIFEFDGKLPNPHDSKHKFSLPVIHVYINSPLISSTAKISKKIPDISFERNNWDYQIIIDGMHEQARIYNANSRLIGNSLGLYVHYINNKTGTRVKDKLNMTDAVMEKIVKTRITAGIPISLIGDPEKGKWQYYVVVGLLDLRNPSAMYAKPFDYIQRDHYPEYSNGNLIIPPLTIGE